MGLCLLYLELLQKFLPYQEVSKLSTMSRLSVWCNNVTVPQVLSASRMACESHPKNEVRPWLWCVLVNCTPLNKSMPRCDWTIGVRDHGHSEKHGFCKTWVNTAIHMPSVRCAGLFYESGMLHDVLSGKNLLERLCWASPKDSLVLSWTPCESLLCCKLGRGILLQWSLIGCAAGSRLVFVY